MVLFYRPEAWRIPGRSYPWNQIKKYFLRLAPVICPSLHVHHCMCILWRDRRPVIKDLVKLRGRRREAIKSSFRFSVSFFAVLRKIRIETSKVLVFEERVSRQLLSGVFTVVAVIVLWSPNRGYWDITVKCQGHGELWTGKSIGGLV